MKPPAQLYRYRPFDDGLLERELNALRDSYLFSPPFSAMNDPMEAFYDTGCPGDRIAAGIFSDDLAPSIHRSARVHRLANRIAVALADRDDGDNQLWVPHLIDQTVADAAKRRALQPHSGARANATGHRRQCQCQCQCQKNVRTRRKKHLAQLYGLGQVL